MFFLLLAFFLFSLAFISYQMRWSHHQPIAYAFYGLISLLTGLTIGIYWTPIYMARYYLYIISGIIFIIVPIIIFLFVILVLLKTFKHPRLAIGDRILSWAYAFLLLILFFATLTSIMVYEASPLNAVIHFLIQLTLYLVMTLLAYVILLLLVHASPSKGHYRIIVILGQKIEDIEDLTQPLSARLDRALDTYLSYNHRKQRQTIFLVSGGQTDSNFPSEARLMRDYLLARGVPKEQILVDGQAMNTEENFRYCRYILDQRGIRGDVLVISSWFHLVRAYYYAWRYGLKADFKGSKTRLGLSFYYLIRDYLAFILLTKEMNLIYLVLVVVYMGWLA